MIVEIKDRNGFFFSLEDLLYEFILF